jgi:hypothetical protein
VARTDRPVQGPDKYELSVDLTTATTLGLSARSTLLTSADEVVE